MEHTTYATSKTVVSGDSITAEDTPLDCPTCGAELGKLIETGGRTLLLMGKFYHTHFDGYCAECGKSFGWSSSGQGLARLVARMVKRRQE